MILSGQGAYANPNDDAIEVLEEYGVVLENQQPASESQAEPDEVVVAGSESAVVDTAMPGVVQTIDEHHTAVVADLGADQEAGYLVLWDAEAPGEFDFNVNHEGNAVELVSDGQSGIVFIIEDGQLVGYVEPAWATDANGESLVTYYSVAGATITQHINHDGTTAFPVVADPTIRWGWPTVIHFNAWETGMIASSAPTAAVIGAFCSAVGGVKAAAACGGSAYALVQWAQWARASGKCMEARYYPGQPWAYPSITWC